MKVLFVVSEVTPIIKLGGLGDVAGSLPKALENLGVDVDVAVPFFPVAKTENIKLYKTFDLNVPFSNNTYTIEVFNTKLPESNVDVFMFKNAEFFAQGGKEAFANNVSETEMFSFFAKSVVEFVKSRFNTYDLVHCNDWHTGLVTHLLDDELSSTRPATVFTVHNLLYQGVGGLKLVSDAGFIPGDHKLIDWDIQDGDLNLMLQGITSSDYVTAVSPSYAKEILTHEFGGNLEEVLQAKSGRIKGILNGLDYTHWPRNYDVSNLVEGKKSAKKKLQEKLGLEVCDKPLFGFVGRLDPNQKGLDILFEVIPEIVNLGGQYALLGMGDPSWEEKLNGLHDGKNVAINVEFNVDLSYLIYAGSDFLTVPSKYEPCGLIQLIAMWYGTIPVAHATGGLRDSIKDGVTGFLFEEYSSESFLGAVKRAFDIYKTPQKKNLVAQNAIREDFSWDRSAGEYKELYEKAVRLRKLAVELSEEE